MNNIRDQINYKYVMEVPGRLATHNRRVQFLDTLAILLGCMETLGGEFPDGRRPDVLRLDSRRGILFVGEAKHSELPTCHATQERLLEYFRWLAVHVAKEGRVGVLAICFGRSADTCGWVETVFLLGREVALEHVDHGVKQFDAKSDHTTLAHWQRVQVRSTGVFESSSVRISCGLI